MIILALHDLCINFMLPFNLIVVRNKKILTINLNFSESRKDVS